MRSKFKIRSDRVVFMEFSIVLYLFVHRDICVAIHLYDMHIAYCVGNCVLSVAEVRALHGAKLLFCLINRALFVLLVSSNQFRSQHHD